MRDFDTQRAGAAAPGPMARVFRPARKTLRPPVRFEDTTPTTGEGLKEAAPRHASPAPAKTLASSRAPAGRTVRARRPHAAPPSPAAAHAPGAAAPTSPCGVGDAAPYHQVHVAGLVLERHEHHAAGAAGTLARDDDAAGGDRGAVRQPGNLGGRLPAALPEPRAQERKRVPPQRESERAVVRDDVLAFRRGTQEGQAFGPFHGRRER
jgi:hypothetical protein